MDKSNKSNVIMDTLRGDMGTQSGDMIKQSGDMITHSGDMITQSGDMSTHSSMQVLMFFHLQSFLSRNSTISS